jgi:hypothetical protein
MYQQNPSLSQVHHLFSSLSMNVIVAKWFHAFPIQICGEHNQVVQIHAEKVVLSPINLVEVGPGHFDRYYDHLKLVLRALVICL